MISDMMHFGLTCVPILFNISTYRSYLIQLSVRDFPMKSNDIKPGPELYQKVRGGFIADGTTLAAWCREHGYSPTNARSALMGAWNGPKGRQLRRQLAEDSGVIRTSEPRSAVSA